MAYRSVRVSDLSGKEGADSDFVTVVVRKHPALEEPVQFDALPAELKGLKGTADLVVLEIRNGDTEQVIVTLEDFKKLSPTIDDVLANADGLRGRRKGFRPTSTPSDGE